MTDELETLLRTFAEGAPEFQLRCPNKAFHADHSLPGFNDCPLCLSFFWVPAVRQPDGSTRYVHAGDVFEWLAYWASTTDDGLGVVEFFELEPGYYQVKVRNTDLAPKGEGKSSLEASLRCAIAAQQAGKEA